MPPELENSAISGDNPARDPSAGQDTDVRLPRRWRGPAYIAGAVLCVLTLGLWARGFWLNLGLPPLHHFAPFPVEWAFARLALAGEPVIIAYKLLFGFVPIALYTVMSVLLFLRRSDRLVALLTAVALVTMGTAISDSMGLLMELQPNLRLPVLVSLFTGWSIAGLTTYVFPDGRFAPRWTGVIVVPFLMLWWVLLSKPVLAFAVMAPDYVYATRYWMGWIGVVGTVVLPAGAICAGVYRYRRVSSPVQRQQMKWVALTVAVALSSFFLWAGVDSLRRESLLWVVAACYLLLKIASAAVPVSIALAILRFRLWDIDVLINRTIIYGSLTLVLAAIYFGGIYLLQGLVRTVTSQRSDVAVVVVTLGVVALARPLHRTIQDGVDRRFYRRKYDAARTLAAFSARLRHETDLERLQADLLAVVGETMQPAHCSLWLRPMGEPQAAARANGPGTTER